MPDQVVRPVAVPASACWSPESGQWEERSHDLAGLPIGSFRAWRDNGSLAFEAFYEDGLLRGPFRKFHGDGAVAREGFYVNGQLEGVVVAYASGEQGGLPLRGCCVPTGAARMEARYERGRLRSETFFDGEGHALLSNGGRRPPRPRSVPEDAGFDESSQRWWSGAHDRETGGSIGTWSWWGQDGLRNEEVDYEQGLRVTARRFAADGELVEVTSFARHESDGFETIPQGPWRRLLWGAEAESWGGPAGDYERAWVEGTFDRNQSVGPWALRTHDGRVLWERDLGLPVDAEVVTSSDAFADVVWSQSAWLALADAFLVQGRLREWLVAKARAVAQGSDPQTFVRDVAARVLPKPDAARRAQSCGEVTDVVTLLDALVTGAHTYDVLRRLAEVMPAWHGVARDLTEACVRLQPDDLRCYLARALVRIERGDDAGVHDDLKRLSEVVDNAASFFDETLAVFRPTYAFGPTKHTLAALKEEIALEVAQPLTAVLGVAAVYATRLLLLRQALGAFGVSEAAWAPPHLTSFIPSGPVQLRNDKAVIEDEDDDGQVEQTVVQIDETLLSLLNQGSGVSAIIGRARADWAGLCWLLWAVGLDEVAVPTQVTSRATFPQALALAVERAWRARDQVVTSGLRSMTQGVADFEWEGHAVGELSPSFLQVCIDEWVEARAVLLWLSNAGNVSPFQDDLRRV